MTTESPPPGHTHSLPGGTAVVLLGRGGMGPAARKELDAMEQALRAHLPGVPIAQAYVDRASPTLPEALQALHAQAVTRIVVQPVFVPGETALLRWLEKVCLRWRSRQPAGEGAPALPAIAFAPALGGLQALADVLARNVCQHADQTDLARDAGENWQHDPVAWSSVPPHRRHVLFCMGPRCTALGATALWQHLGETLRASGQWQKTVMTLQTSCQYPCNHGPLMIVYPDGKWYGRLDEAAITRIVQTHLDAGTTDAEHLVHQTGRQEDSAAELSDQPPPCTDDA